MDVSPDVAARIIKKKAMYGRCIDTKEWDKLDQVMLPDAQLSFRNADGSPLTVGNTCLVFPSAGSFATFFKRFFAKAQTLHMFSLGELEQTGPDEVKAIWGMEDEIILRGSAGFVEIRGGGYYHEIWTRKDADWFLKSLNLYRTYTKTSLVAKILAALQKYLGFAFY
ncbi:hypothetical protein EDB81DRAFT_872367 [Dactylonectria macrodidyma]|uniref:SnoaL-like domain-containing protein n=1 Tax=Dactylonectria macrodidyma TaxID=307937 RepID=A0A9P9ILC2_9HYPO|nr:hypothetical protein EDB81DRAFT_872367 [Dactylonectria macrodidyma]